MSGLIDTTEMYLRTVFELEEEGVVPLRARIAERLGQSGPTVSQTVARMERDGLLVVEGDRHLELTESGRATATRVMRKHRLAERLLVDVIGMPWEDVHAEACRWEHVMSDDVERRVFDLLGRPTESPFGNPIPGLAELDAVAVREADEGHALISVAEVASEAGRAVRVRRIGEPVQSDVALLRGLKRAGAVPGGVVEARLSTDGVQLGRGGTGVEVDLDAAAHVLVDATDATEAR